MSTSRSGRLLSRCSAARRRACRKRRSERGRSSGHRGGVGPTKSVSLCRLSLRRHFEFAGDVAALLRQTAKTVGIALDLVDMRVALLVQRPEQFAHPLEERGEIGGLFVLGIGALADMDVEPETGEALFGERLAASKP